MANPIGQIKSPYADPYKGDSGFGFFINNALSAIVTIAGLAFLVYLLIGGIKYLTASGDSKATQSARDTITHGLIGLSIVALVWFVTITIQTVLGIKILSPSFTGPSGKFDLGWIVNPTGYTTAPEGMGLVDFINNAFNAVVVVAGLAFLIYFVVGGIKYITAAGDSKAAQSARDSITHALIGLVIVTLVWFVGKIVGTVLGIDILAPVFKGP